MFADAPPTTVGLRNRLTFATLALITIGIGLWVHRSGVAFSPVVRDVLGDALWAMMIYWWTGVAAPRAKPWQRGVAAVVLCVAVELSQLYHSSSLDALRRTVPGQLVLGSGFDPRDLAAYTLGVLTAFLLETVASAAAKGTLPFSKGDAPLYGNSKGSVPNDGQLTARRRGR